MRINCSSRFLYLRSCKTFFIATVSPFSRHFAYKRQGFSQPHKSRNVAAISEINKMCAHLPEKQLQMIQSPRHVQPCNWLSAPNYIRTKTHFQFLIRNHFPIVQDSIGDTHKNIFNGETFLNYKDILFTCFGSPFFPPMVVEIIWPVTAPFTSITGADISYSPHQIYISDKRLLKPIQHYPTKNKNDHNPPQRYHWGSISHTNLTILNMKHGIWTNLVIAIRNQWVTRYTFF